MTSHIRLLRKLSACREAIEWAKTQPNWASCWANCERGDWMLWVLDELAGEPMSDERRPLVLCCCEVARPSLAHIPEGEARPIKSIELAEKWARGEEVTEQQLRRVAAASNSAAVTATAAYAYAAAYAADAAAYAAYAVTATAADAAVTATAADAAAAAAAADAAARNASLAASADIVRKHFPVAPELMEVA